MVMDLLIQIERLRPHPQVIPRRYFDFIDYYYSSGAQSRQIPLIPIN